MVIIGIIGILWTLARGRNEMGLFVFFYVVSVVFVSLRILAGDYVNIPAFVLYVVSAGVFAVDYLVDEIKAAWRDLA